MNKLGFYIENTSVQFLRDALRTVKPPIILIHAGDRGLLQDIRRELSPDAFVIGRMFVELQQQVAWLDDPDPAARGREFANRILGYDFGLAQEKGANGRLLIDAWMSLNEALPGPAAYADRELPEEFKRRATALDRFQMAFREQLRSRGLEAVAFNFGAGNYIQADHYTQWFPHTLESYIYLGFHEYGWPTLMEDPHRGTATSALFYRNCLQGIRRQYGDRHRAIITEAGLARMYKHPRDGAGDVGWLYPGDTISEDQYWESLRWYNNELLQDEYVLGACLFQVGHAGRWESFRHLGQDNQQRPILIISKIATLAQEPPPGITTPEPPPEDADLPTLQQQIADLVASLQAAANLTADFPAQVRALDQVLDGLAPVAVQAASLPRDLERLLARLDTQSEALRRLLAEGQADPDSVARLQARIDALRAQILGLQPEAAQAATLDHRVQQAQSDLAALEPGAAQATALHDQVMPLLAEAQQLAAVAGPPPVRAAMPPMKDRRRTRPVRPEEDEGRAPTAQTEDYPTRPLTAIKRIVVHHTMTREDITPERLAEMRIGRGLPGINYHYLITGDGTIHWTQPLTALLPHTGVAAVNQDGVAVALAGNFSQKVPVDAQLAGAAEVIAWLLGELDLDPDVVMGRSEVDPEVISPGAQWLQGAQFKSTLLAQITRIQAGT